MQTKESSPVYRKTKKLYTYQNYLELPDDRNHYEILEGELIITPAPYLIHQDVSRNIEFLFETYIRRHSSGKLYHAPCDVVLSDHNIVQPDLVFVSNANKQILGDANIQGAPDLIIEILSSSTTYYDLFDKKELYENFGVEEYWIVDPKKQWIEIYVLVDGKYQLYKRCEKAGTIQSYILEKFEMSLNDIFDQEKK